MSAKGQADPLPPLLISAFVNAPYFHNGSAASLDDVAYPQKIQHSPSCIPCDYVPTGHLAHRSKDQKKENMQFND
jgi:hypothetical protein